MIFQPFSDSANVYKLTRHSCQSNLFLILTGYGIICVTKVGYVARPVPNSIRNVFPSLTSICPIVEFGFDQLEASKMKEFFGDK